MGVASFFAEPFMGSLFEFSFEGTGAVAEGRAATIVDCMAEVGGGTIQTPAGLARSWQGKGNYPGVDSWRNITLNEGTLVVGGLPGQTEYYSTMKSLERINFVKDDFWMGLQVKPHDIFGYRQDIGVFRVSYDTPAAFGTTYANPQFGGGGLPQLFVPDYSSFELITKLILK